MMGERQVRQEALFYGFSLEEHVPADHLLRAIDRFVELGDIRRQLKPSCSAIGRPSVDPELTIRMLLIGCCCGIRSERRLCEEVHLNLAYRWFCRLGLNGRVPDHSAFSKNRHGRFRDSDLLRRLFEATVRRCMAEAPDHSTFRTTFRDRPRSRQIDVIDRPSAKCRRRIFAIGSTTSLPNMTLEHHGSHRERLPQRGPLWTPITPPAEPLLHAETHASALRKRARAARPSVAGGHSSRNPSVAVGKGDVAERIAWRRRRPNHRRFDGHGPPDSCGVASAGPSRRKPECPGEEARFGRGWVSVSSGRQG
jgi:transposase